MDASRVDMQKLAPELIKQAIGKIHKGETNGDIQETNLIITAAMYEMIEEMYENPALVFGRLFRKYPALFLPAIMVTWVLTGASALAVLIAFVGKLGMVVTFP